MTLEIVLGGDAAAEDLAKASGPLFLAAVYVLRRMQVDPDFADVMILTETHERLCQAVALATGADIAELRRETSEDRQPAHRRREPRRLVAEGRLEAIEARISGESCGLGGDHSVDRAGEGCLACDVLALARGGR